MRGMGSKHASVFWNLAKQPISRQFLSREEVLEAPCPSL